MPAAKLSLVSRRNSNAHRKRLIYTPQSVAGATDALLLLLSSPPVLLHAFSKRFNNHFLSLPFCHHVGQGRVWLKNDSLEKSQSAKQGNRPMSTKLCERLRSWSRAVIIRQNNCAQSAPRRKGTVTTEPNPMRTSLKKTHLPTDVPFQQRVRSSSAALRHRLFPNRCHQPM